uniref:Protein kinase domain-containing protein n=1 Tax=Leersia perrieri TaxID=77586 RepID=A0A0D9XSY2_9ORYZ
MAPSFPTAMLLLLLILLMLHASSATAALFTCTTPTPSPCKSALGYRIQTSTTYTQIFSLFNTTTTLGELLRANGLPPTATPPNTTVKRGLLTVPFPCSCGNNGNNGVGQSHGRRPIYTVRPRDTLYVIARDVFEGFVTFQEIAAANDITSPTQIVVGRQLWIPLPCSCDRVDGYVVTHFAYKVSEVDTVESITAEFGVLEGNLLKTNGMTDPKKLFEGQILDVPLHGKARVRIVLGITLPGSVAILAIAFFIIHIRKRRAAKESPMPWSINQEDFSLDLWTLQTATDNFDERNKLGEGGFGAVYKGSLPDGQQIAVKRLSHCSKQGLNELKNELVLVSKLQHKNLVRLVGVCVEHQEKLLVYEYMPNRSLDTILFDPNKSKELCWEKRFKIIIEIARGLEYLHEESRLKIIHRDLKANNILLDSGLTPKISDFGLAKLFGEDQSHVVTNRIAGTYGYMAPEYAMFGQYSVKSDVFSFGVLILEIVTGKRSMGSYGDHEQSFSLLDLIWQRWNRGTILELVDPSLSVSGAGRQCSLQIDQLLGCIHVALLCVQENPADRPKLSAVTTMISGGSSASLQPPSRPAFCVHPADVMRTAAGIAMDSSGGSSTAASANRVTVTELQPR